MEHKWWVWNSFDCCKKCGVLKRTDGKNSPCKGVIKIRLRNDGAGKYAAMEKSMADIRKTFAEKWNCDPSELFVHASGGQGCYCDCANHGPCEHEFEGWREFDDGCGGETVCKYCGLGAMGHDMWLF